MWLYGRLTVYVTDFNGNLRLKTIGYTSGWPKFVGTAVVGISVAPVLASLQIWQIVCNNNFNDFHEIQLNKFHAV